MHMRSHCKFDMDIHCLGKNGASHSAKSMLMKL